MTVLGKVAGISMSGHVNYSLKDGKGSRLTLLNNWENTGFNFNQEILAELMKEAKHLGVDMFLLDDGWFANKYPRSSDHQGLGDWIETADKFTEWHRTPDLLKQRNTVLNSAFGLSPKW